jgi:hypothetical protein
MAEESIIKYGNVIGSDNTFKVLNDELDTLEARVLSLAKATKGQFSVISPTDSKKIEEYENKIIELEQSLKLLAKQKEVVKKAQKEEVKVTQDQLVQIQAEKLARAEQVKIAKLQAVVLKEETNTIKSLRAQLGLVTLQWAKLTPEQIKNNEANKETGKTARQVVKDKLALTNQLKKLEKQTGDNRRNVGNYTAALGTLGKVAQRIFVGRAIADGVLRLAGFFGDLIEKGKEYNTVLAGLSNSFSKVGSGFAFIGTKILEFFAPAITFVTDALAKLPAVFGGVIAASKQFGSNVASTFEILGLKISKVFQQINKANPFSKQSTAEINANIAAIDRQIQLSGSNQKGLVDAYNEGYNDTLKAQEEFEKNQQSQIGKAERLKAAQEAQTKELERQKKLISEISTIEGARLKAIEELQKDITKAETDNIEDRQEKLLALEDLRAKEERKQRQSSYAELAKLVKDQEDALIQLEGKNSKKVEDFKKSSRNLLLLIEKDFDKLEEEQLKASEQRKLDIRKQFFEENVRQQAKLLEDSNKEVEKQNQLLLDKTTSDLKKQQDEIEASYNYRDRKAKESADKQKELNAEVFQSISENSQKIGELIVATFEKQADVAKENVQKQSEALENARQRAQDGLTSNIKFEKEKLVQLEAEQLRAEKRKQNAAKLTALFNLVASAAASGDKDAVINSIVQFGLLEAAAAAIEGSFFEGSEDIGKAKNPLDANGGRLILAHDNERIVTAKQNKELNGMSNKDLVKNAKLGERISDLYPMSEQLNAAHFAQQSKALTEASRKTDNNAFGAIERGLQEVKRAIINKPTQSDDLVKVSEVAVEVLRKTVSGQMTKTEKIKKYI